MQGNTFRVPAACLPYYVAAVERYMSSEGGIGPGEGNLFSDNRL